MKGLEAIKDRILAQAAGQVKDIESSAMAQAQDMIAGADKDASDHLAACSAADAAEKEAIMMRENSLAVSETRKVMLSVKQDMIAAVMDKAVILLQNMEPARKKELYLSVLGKNIKGGETVRFSAADMSVGKDIEKTSGLDFKTDSLPGDFRGGMIIYRDLIEINMTFDMIVRQNRTELVTIAASELFDKQ